MKQKRGVCKCVNKTRDQALRQRGGRKGIGEGRGGGRGTDILMTEYDV